MGWRPVDGETVYVRRWRGTLTNKKGTGRVRLPDFLGGLAAPLFRVVVTYGRWSKEYPCGLDDVRPLSMKDWRKR